MGMELSQPDDDIPVKSVGFSVLDIGKAEADAVAYVIGTAPSKLGKWHLLLYHIHNELQPSNKRSIYYVHAQHLQNCP